MNAVKEARSCAHIVNGKIIKFLGRGVLVEKDGVQIELHLTRETEIHGDIVDLAFLFENNRIKAATDEDYNIYSMVLWSEAEDEE